MSYFGLLWKARTIEKYRLKYEKEKLNSIVMANAQVPKKSFYQRWRHYSYNTKKKILDFCRKRWPEGSSVSNFFVYLRTDQTFPNFVLKSILGFIGGIILTYLCFMFFVFQLSISLMHAAIMSSVMGVLLTLGLAFSYRVRCLVFLLIPQFFSRIGRYTLTCYALVLILTGPATNTLKNSEVLSESMACSQEQIKTSVKQINDSIKKPFNLMKDSIKTMIGRVKEVAAKINMTLLKINRLVLSIVYALQSSSAWLESITTLCNKKLGTPYEHCSRSLEQGLSDCRVKFGPHFAWVCNVTHITQASCRKLKPLKAMCVFVNFFDGSIVATIKKKLKNFSDHIKVMLSMDVRVHHSYSFSSNTSRTANQIAAGIVTEIRNRADPLLTWLSWSSCVTSLFLLLIIFRAKYYQNMYETRSRFDNRYITKEFRELDLKRLRQGRETVLPLNRRERTKYVTTTSFRLVASERVNLSRSVVLMMITTFKLLIHMIADYSLYWVLVTIRHHGRLQPPLYPGAPDAGIHITGTRPVAGILRALLGSLSIPIATPATSLIPCLPNPYPPDFRRYTQIGVLIFLLWFFALFEPYGLRLRHVVMGKYRPERAKSRATWLYNHILRTRGSFMKYARRKLHRQYKYSTGERLTFQYWLNSYIPCNWLRSLLGIRPKEPQCLLCGTKDEPNDPDTIQIRCETPNCLGVYCARCFSDIGQLCTLCMSPADYGDLSDVSLEKGSSDESTDSDEDTQSSYCHDPPHEPRPGSSNKCGANNSYEYIYYSKLEYKITSKPKKDYFGSVLKSKMKEFQKESLTIFRGKQMTPVMEQKSVGFIEKTSLTFRANQRKCAQNIIKSTVLMKANSNSYCHCHPKYPHSDDPLRHSSEKERTHFKHHSLLGSELKISKHTSNNGSCEEKFLNRTRTETRIISRRQKNIITMKNLELIKNLRKRNISNSLSQLKIMLQIRYYKVLDRKAKVDKQRFYLDDNSLENHYSSSRCEEKSSLKDIFEKLKSFNVPTITSSNKLPKQLRLKFKTILRQKRYIEKNANAVWPFMNTGFSKPMPYYIQSNRFLKNKCLRYTNSDMIRLNFLHNITVCSCTTQQNNPKKTKCKPKKEGNMKRNDVTKDEYIQNIIKCKSSNHCSKNIFVRWYQCWKNSKKKPTTRMLMMEYKKKNKKLRNDNKKYKRKKKYKNTGHDSKVIKQYLSNDDEATRRFRLTTYLEGQEWYRTNTDETRGNNNVIDEKKVEIKPKPHSTQKSKLRKKSQEKVTEVFNIHPQIVEIDYQNATKSLNAGDLLCEHILEKTKPLKLADNQTNKKISKLVKVIPSVKKEKSRLTSTVGKIQSTSEEVFIAEVHPSSDEKIQKKPKKIGTINIKTGGNIKEKVEEVLPELNNKVSLQNCDKLSEERKLEEEGERNSVSDIKIKTIKSKDETKNSTLKGSQHRLTVMKMLCSTIFSFKSNKGTQKDLDKEVENTDKVLQTKEEMKPQLIDALQQTDDFLQFVDKHVTCSPSVTSRSCQYFIENNYKNECAFQTAKKSVREMCDAPVETVTTKCTCATQYTSCTREIGTNHPNCLKKIQNSAVQCSDISPSLNRYELIQERLPIKDSRYVSEGSESTETSPSDNCEISERTTTDTTVCSFIRMEYANHNSVKRNDKKYKVVVITKANRSTGTDRTEVCDVSTITSDWWSPLSEKKDMKEKVAVASKDKRVPRKKVRKMREAGATTEGRIVKFKSDNEVMSPSRYLLESQRYYNELFTNMYQYQRKDSDLQHKGDHFRHDHKRNHHTIKTGDELYPLKQHHHRYRKVNLRQINTLLSNERLWIVEGVTNHQTINPYTSVQWQRHKCD